MTKAADEISDEEIHETTDNDRNIESSSSSIERNGGASSSSHRDKKSGKHIL